MIVVDASTAISWFCSDEKDAFSEKSLQTVVDGRAIVPPIFPSEVANGLTVAHRRKRVSESDIRDALDDLGDLPLELAAPRFDLSEELALARAHNLTMYDAMYLALAKREGVKLYTRDHALYQAAIKEGVAVEPVE